MTGRIGATALLLWLAAVILGQMAGCAAPEFRRVRAMAAEGGGAIGYAAPF